MLFQGSWIYSSIDLRTRPEELQPEKEKPLEETTRIRSTRSHSGQSLEDRSIATVIIVSVWGYAAGSMSDAIFVGMPVFLSMPTASLLSLAVAWQENH